MKISSAHDIAVAFLLNLSSKPRTLESVSIQIGCSISHLEQIARKLRSADQIHSVRGPGGGYVLDRPLARITAADVIAAISSGNGRQLTGLMDEILLRAARIPLSEIKTKEAFGGR